MATNVFFLSGTGGSIGVYDQWTNGQQFTAKSGTPQNWMKYPAGGARGSGVVSLNRASVTGTTPGIELTSNGFPVVWVSPPIDTSFTLSGTVTFNMWGLESSMSANAGIGCSVYRLDYDTMNWTLIVSSAFTTELGTAAAVNNFTAAPTSTAMRRGDRIALVPYFDDAGGTMATGFTLTFGYNGNSAAANGDSYIQFTENFGFLTSFSVVQFLNCSQAAASGSINPTGNVEKQLAFSNPASSTTAVTSTTTGPTSPRQWTDTSGGNALEWYTDQLSAATLSGPLLYDSTAMLQSNAAANCTVLTQVAICDANGANCTIWGTGGGGTDGTLQYVELNTVSDSVQHYICGPDAAIPDGGRLRLIIYQDDAYGRDVAGAEATGHTSTLNYGNNNTRLQVGQTLTAYTAPSQVLPRSPYVQLLPQ